MTNEEIYFTTPSADAFRVAELQSKNDKERWLSGYTPDAGDFGAVESPTTKTHESEITTLRMKRECELNQSIIEKLKYKLESLNVKEESLISMRDKVMRDEHSTLADRETVFEELHDVSKQLLETTTSLKNMRN